MLNNSSRGELKQMTLANRFGEWLCILKRPICKSRSFPPPPPSPPLHTGLFEDILLFNKNPYVIRLQKQKEKTTVQRSLVRSNHVTPKVITVLEQVRFACQKMLERERAKCSNKAIIYDAKSQKVFCCSNGRRRHASLTQQVTFDDVSFPAAKKLELPSCSVSPKGNSVFAHCDRKDSFSSVVKQPPTI